MRTGRQSSEGSRRWAAGLRDGLALRIGERTGGTRPAQEGKLAQKGRGRAARPVRSGSAADVSGGFPALSVAHPSPDDLGASLVAARRSGTLVAGPWPGIDDEDMAWAVQAAASQAMLEAGTPQIGYATLLLPGRRANVPGGHVHADRLIHGPLFDDQLVGDRQVVRLPCGMLGAQSCLLLTIGRSYPLKGEEIGRHTAISAVAGCRPALALLGRRSVGPAPLTIPDAIADGALHVATVGGPSLEWDAVARAQADVAMVVDGHVLARIPLAALFDRAISALVGLALDLAVRGSHLDATDRVTAGARLPALQVLPGQELRLDAGGLGTVATRLA